MSFAGIFLAWIVELFEFGLAIHGIAIDTNFGIQAVQVALLGDNQRVNLQEGHIVVLEQFSQAQENMHELLDVLAFQAELKSELATLVGLRAGQWINFYFEDLLWRLFGNFLDLYTLPIGHRR